jgi:FixJ family two-component response regulator
VAAAPVISIIDDDESVLRSLGLLVASAGMGVEMFSSAEEFLGSEREIDPACLILDIGLPGMSGLGLQQHLAACGRRIPTLMITARDNEQWRVQAFRAGAVAFLLKPFGKEELLEAIASALISRKK